MLISLCIQGIYSIALYVYCYQEAIVLELHEGQPHLYIDPEIYIGGGPELYKKSGLYTLNILGFLYFYLVFIKLYLFPNDYRL